ncbi:MAG: DUF4388 domain-containing protein [Leptospirillia bacterium]
MALTGSLLDFNFTDILQLIRMQRKSGVLTLVRRDGKVRLRFKDGEVVHADSSRLPMKKTLGRWLVRESLTTDKKWMQAVGRHKESGVPLDETAAEIAGVDAQILRTLAAYHRREVLFSLFRWLEGDYSFDLEEKPVKTVVSGLQPVNTDDILMDAAGRDEEWPRIDRLVPAMNVIFGLTGGDEKPSGLSEDKRFVLAQVDGVRDVDEIIDQSPFGQYETCLALADLVEEGWVETVGIRPAPEPVAVRESRSATPVYPVKSSPLWSAFAVGGASVCAVLLCGVFLFSVVTGGTAKEPGGFSVSTASYRDHQVRQAIAAYRLMYDRFPESLAELGSSGLITDPDTLTGMHYLLDADGYTLSGG